MSSSASLVDHIALDQSWFEEPLDISDASAADHGARLHYQLTRIPATRSSSHAIAPDLHGLAAASASHDDLCTLNTFYVAQGFKDIGLYGPSTDLKRQARNRFICNIINTPNGPMSRLHALTDSPLNAPLVTSHLMNSKTYAGALSDSFPLHICAYYVNRAFNPTMRIYRNETTPPHIT